jgi:hypothetical protein
MKEDSSLITVFFLFFMNVIELLVAETIITNIQTYLIMIMDAHNFLM